MGDEPALTAFLCWHLHRSGSRSYRDIGAARGVTAQEAKELCRRVGEVLTHSEWSQYGKVGTSNFARLQAMAAYESKTLADMAAMPDRELMQTPNIGRAVVSWLRANPSAIDVDRLIRALE